METTQITERFEKRKLIVTLGEAGAPAQCQWLGVLFTERQDGSEFRPPYTEYRDATAEDVEAYLGKAVVDVQSVIAAKDEIILGVRSEAAAMLAAKDEIIAACRARIAEQEQEIARLQEAVNSAAV